MVGTFPLNVQAGSPQYTLASQITPSSSTTLITITNTDSIDPISNAYYTIQNEDGTKWCTFYVSNWRVGDLPKTYNLLCTYTSSNTSDVFSEGSVCWCIWCKEYYESLVTPISTINNDISTINGEINTLTPKVDDSFINATKVGDSTLRLTRNDGTTVDISFPESGIKVRNVSGESANNIVSNKNELVVVESCILTGEIDPSGIVSIENGLGYLIDTSNKNNIIAPGHSIHLGFDVTITVNGLLYDGAYVSIVV